MSCLQSKFYKFHYAVFAISFKHVQSSIFDQSIFKTFYFNICSKETVLLFFKLVKILYLLSISMKQHKEFNVMNFQIEQQCYTVAINGNAAVYIEIQTKGCVLYLTAWKVAPIIKILLPS